MKSSKKNTKLTLPVIALVILLVVLVGSLFLRKNKSVELPPPPTISESTPAGAQGKIAATDPQVRTEVMMKINEQREKLGMSALMMDDNLCRIGKSAADEQANIYPKEIDSDYFQKDIEKMGFSKIEHTELTVDDEVLKEYEKEGKKVDLNDEYLTQAFTTEGALVEHSLDSKTTHGCVTISTEGMGAKPFVYFVSAVK